MKTKHRTIQVILLLCGLLPVLTATAQEQSIRPGINRHFEDPDWQRWVNTFERPGREVYDQRHVIVAASKVRPGMTVADIGAGTGLFTRLFAPAVEPDGTVYAIDIASTFIDNILHTCREQGLSNVTGIVNTPTDIGLPANAIDLAFITDTYHHFEYPQQTLASIHQALRREGRVIIIDFRRDPRISSNWVMGHVRSNKAQVIQEMQAAGFRLVDDKPLMRTNYFLEFVKHGKEKSE
ncbi:MAG: methyltransferase domain-containing protein [Gammaproteobacteria bacterium]|nr:methyltransferase domain-containing protein [Gammaproteobacteria bacterium]